MRRSAAFAADLSFYLNSVWIYLRDCIYYTGVYDLGAAKSCFISCKFVCFLG